MKKLLLLLLIASSISIAQQNFKLNAQIRPRFEFDNRDFNTSNSATTYSLLRTRLSATFTPSNEITGFVQLQDARIFGEETSTTANMKNVDLHQAYLKLDKMFSSPFDLKVGRFELLYSNERLVGISNWGNTGRSFNGVVLTLNNEKVKTEFFAVKEFEKNAVGDTNDQNMYGLFLDLKLSPQYQINPIFIWQKITPTTNLNRFTAGTYIKGNLGNITHEEEIYYQFGNMKSSKEYDISSYFFAMSLTYNFNLSSKPFVGLGIDYSSGDDDLTDNKYKVFNTIYGTGHKFYGYMDYFTNLPVDTYNLGLSDIYFKGGLNLNQELKATAIIHLFNSSAEYKLKNGNTSKNFGSEIDLLFNYNYSKTITFESGFSIFTPYDIFKEKKGKDTSSWLYLMVIANL